MLRTLQLSRCVHCHDERLDSGSDGLMGALPSRYHGINALMIADPWAPPHAIESLSQWPYQLTALFIGDHPDLIKFPPTWTTEITQLFFDIHRDSLNYVKVGETQSVLQVLPDYLLFPHPSSLELSGDLLFPITPYSPKDTILASSTH